MAHFFTLDCSLPILAIPGSLPKASTPIQALPQGVLWKGTQAKTKDLLYIQDTNGNTRLDFLNVNQNNTI